MVSRSALTHKKRHEGPLSDAQGDGTRSGQGKARDKALPALRTQLRLQGQPGCPLRLHDGPVDSGNPGSHSGALQRMPVRIGNKYLRGASLYRIDSMKTQHLCTAQDLDTTAHQNPIHSRLKKIVIETTQRIYVLFTRRFPARG